MQCSTNPANLQEPARLASNRPQLHPILVFRDHGHWHRVHPSTQPALQRRMDLLDIRRHILPQCRAVRPLPRDFNPAIRSLARDLGKDDTPSCAVAVHGYLSNGTGDDCEYGCICLRARLGGVGNDSRRRRPLNGITARG